jgi:hypothetical protein
MLCSHQLLTLAATENDMEQESAPQRLTALGRAAWLKRIFARLCRGKDPRRDRERRLRVARIRPIILLAPKPFAPFTAQ